MFNQLTKMYLEVDEMSSGRIVLKALKVHIWFVTSGPNSMWIQSFVRVSGIGFVIFKRVIIY